MDEAGRAVVFALGARETGDLVAGAQVKATDEGGAHVGVVGAGQVFLRPQEAVTVAAFVHDFKQAAARLLAAFFGLLAHENVDQVRLAERFEIAQAGVIRQFPQRIETLFAEADAVALVVVG